MNDASTDGTSDIINTYGDKVKHTVNEHNLGQFDNVNKGISLARGEFVCVYHADDIYAPEIVEREAEYLMRNENAGAVFCLDIFIDETGNEYHRLAIPGEVQGGGPFTYKTILNALLKYKNVFLVGPTSMVRRSVYAEADPYNEEEYGIAGDLDMWMRISRSYNIGIIEEHLHYYRHNHGNLSQEYYTLRTEPEKFFKMMQKHLDEGGLELATAESLRAYRAHNAEDKLMLAITSYILDRFDSGRQRISEVRIRDIANSPQVQRIRLVALYLIMSVLLHLPRVEMIADVFRKRWH